MELRNWKIHQHPTGPYQLAGNIYNDTKGRFNDGDYVVTSQIKSIDFENGVAQTRNTKYILA